MLTAPTMHCTLPSCIALYSVYLFGLAVAEHVLEFGMGAMTTKTPENLCVRNH